VYVVTSIGSVATNWVLTRSDDADTFGFAGPDTLSEGSTFFVQEGTTGAGETYTCNTVGTITFGTTNITFAQVSSAQIYSAGTGLTLSGTQFSITNTGTAGTYGSASQVPVFVTNAQGQVTSVTNTAIAINGSAVSGNITGQAGSVANALTAGTFLTSGGTYNGSAARTFAVDATSANTASKVVARDASGNFSAGTITAALSGNATSATNVAGGAANRIVFNTGSGATSFVVAPTASGQVLSWNGSAFAYVAGTISGVALGSNLNSLTAGTYLTGTAYNGSGAQTWTVDATSANTVSKVVARDASGNFSAGTITAALNGNATTSSSTSGNAATATTLQTARAINGVSFDGSANITLPTVNTSGDQSVAGVKTFSSTTNFIASGNQLLLKNSTANDSTVIHRTDGTDYYILLSAAGTTPNGTWNTLRPFVITKSNGLLTSQNGQAFSGGTTVAGTLTSTGILNPAQILQGTPNTFVRDYASGYSTTHTPTAPQEMGRITFTGNSQNITIIGEIRGATGASVGVTRFILDLRSNTLPSKSFTLFEEDITNLGQLIRVRVYQDTASGLVIIGYSCTTALQNIGWSFRVQERGNYNYLQQVTALTPINTVGLTEVNLTSTVRTMSGSLVVLGGISGGTF
jgi:hypothetical protein